MGGTASEPSEPEQVPQDLEFNEEDLEVVEISDDGLKLADLSTKQAEKQAKKTAKKLMTPEEQKQHRKKQIIITSVVSAVWLLLLLAIPVTRWPLLNLIGFRGDLQIQALDQAGDKPLYKAVVRLEDGSVGKTNKEGVLTFTNARLGKRTVVISKPGYADLNTTTTNSLGRTRRELKLKAIGIKLDVDIKDWLSGRVIEGATVNYKDSSAISDKTGRATLIIAPTDQEEVTIKLSAPGYLEKETTADITASSREVLLVSSAKDYFVSKRDGRFDIFSSNIDGTNQQKIIEATGKEDEGLLQFSINKNNKQAILVANRDGKMQSGKIVAGVYIVDLEKSTLKKVDEGSDVQLLDWADNTMAYTKTVAELNYDDAVLSRLMGYNAANNKLSEFASSNYFGVALAASNKVFYLPADAYRPAEEGSLVSIDVSSGAKKTYLSGKQPQYITRASFSTLEIQDTAGNSYELQLANGATKLIDHRPANSLSIALSSGGQKAAWADKRDGQGVLIARDLKSSEEKIIVRAGGLAAPTRFVTDDLVVARVATGQETADYVVSLSSGKITKVVDVSNVSSGTSASL